MSIGEKNIYRNRSGDRDAQLEAEIKELEEKGKPQEEEKKIPEKSKDPTEETWAKRYADGRRYQQTLADKITGLEAQLKAKSTEVKYPKTPEEVSEWKKVYPDLWGIMKTIALEEVDGSKKVVEERFKELDEKEKMLARREAYRELLGFHPDFDEVKETKEFEDWVMDQPKWVYEALYLNETDARAAARAIDLYKLDTGVTAKETKKKKEAETREAAQSIRTPSGNAPDRDTAKWSESKVAELNRRDTEKYWPQIEAAISDGTFVYDLSGAAR